ncbi:gamma-glutamyltransferase [candidate division KSB1 bacterium]|nr:gamma-glutamyltransferase [candidate division KSB1 bacterium]
MVVTSDELASQVGVDILRHGGNAVDAAVAIGFALAVVYPTAGNLGGGGFMALHLPDGTATTIDFREKAPLAATRNMYLDADGNVIDGLSLNGYLASGVPGTVAGLTLAHKCFGSMKLKTVIDPAIRLAENGFPVSYRFAHDMQRLRDACDAYPATRKVFRKPDGQPYIEGDIFRQPDLANTLQLIAKEGADAFYKGRIAWLIASDMKKNGGLITRDDLERYSPVERKPVIGMYHGYEIISMPPPSSGGIAIIQALNVLENFDLHKMQYGSSEYVHVLTEVLKYVYHDRATYLGDPDFNKIPIDALISNVYAQALAGKIDTLKSTPSDSIMPPSPHFYEGNHTTHYSVIDNAGMTVAVTTTINTGYGSKVVIRDAGFLMNNEMDDFTSKPGAPNYFGLIQSDVNAIQPEKRMLSSMSPTIICKDGQVVMTLGSMGGSRIITAVMQIILNVLENGMNIQEAVDAPRIHHQWQPNVLSCERFALAPDVRIRLEQMGHAIEIFPCYDSEAHAIFVDHEHGVYLGAADSRFTGSALGY